MNSREEIQDIKEDYLPGTRVRLVKMIDVQSPPSGTEGTVHYVDDTGSIMVAWDNGSNLGIILGVDEFEIISYRR